MELHNVQLLLPLPTEQTFLVETCTLGSVTIDHLILKVRRITTCAFSVPLISFFDSVNGNIEKQMCASQIEISLILHCDLLQGG